MAGYKTSDAILKLNLLFHINVRIANFKFVLLQDPLFLFSIMDASIQEYFEKNNQKAHVFQRACWI